MRKVAFIEVRDYFSLVSGDLRRIKRNLVQKKGLGTSAVRSEDQDAPVGLSVMLNHTFDANPGAEIRLGGLPQSLFLP